MKSRTEEWIAAPYVRDEVDVTSEDSFPASDPPSWTPVVRSGSPSRVERRAETSVPPRAVLHPTDYSDASRCAFEIACRLAPAGG